MRGGGSYFLCVASCAGHKIQFRYIGQQPLFFETFSIVLNIQTRMFTTSVPQSAIISPGRAMYNYRKEAVIELLDSGTDHVPRNGREVKCGRSPGRSAITNDDGCHGFVNLLWDNMTQF